MPERRNGTLGIIAGGGTAGRMTARSATWSRTGLCMLVFVASNCAFAACDHASTGIRLNQVGFRIDADKRAILATTATHPVGWKLIDDSGTTRAQGRSVNYGADPVSGEHVQRIDFSSFRDAGSGFRITTGCAGSHPFSIGESPYRQLKYDALAYFYHNRSGVPVDEAYAGGKAWSRPAGHPHDVATCRHGKDGRGNKWPGCNYKLDLTGGWYDAGDQGKYVVNGGIAVWTLLNLYERDRSVGRDSAFADGLVKIPEAGNNVNDLLDEVRFEMEFLLSMQAPDGATARVPVDIKQDRADLPFTKIDASGMAHHKIADENWTKLPTPPYLDKERRYLYPVSTAATLNLAATAAQCARVWREIDDVFASRCLAAARNAYSAAKRNPGVYFIADFSGSGLYPDGNLDDEFFWAAAELFVTTGNETYANDLRRSRYFSESLRREPAWPRVAPLGVITLAMLPNGLKPAERQAMRQHVIAAAERFRSERERSGYYIPWSTRRYPWGSNSNILNRAIILGLAWDFTGDRSFRNAVVDAIDYILGRNPLDQSFVSGYGERPMRHPYHRFWAPSFDARLPPPPPGALSGGPNSRYSTDEVARSLIDAGCAPQTCWQDNARAYSMNEVAINWNAPLVWVAAFLDED